MANRTAKNPIVIDTTDTAIAGPLKLCRVTWNGTAATNKDIAASDDLTLKWKDGSGDILFAHRATADNLGPIVVFEGGVWNLSEGLYIEDLDGGELHLWKA